MQTADRLVFRPLALFRVEPGGQKFRARGPGFDARLAVEFLCAALFERPTVPGRVVAGGVEFGGVRFEVDPRDVPPPEGAEVRPYVGEVEAVRAQQGGQQS